MNYGSLSSSWLKSSIIYQIYPRSFKDSNGDGIGDLSGIIEKLEYLQELGVGAIWLSPIYTSPMVDGGYDVADYYNIDPIFGTFSDFDRLLKEFHQRDIKVILDFVPCHTSSQHPWFKKSRLSKNNSMRNWYIWADSKSDGSPPNNWLSTFGGSAWEYDEETRQYYLHSFFKEQPNLNWRNQKVKEEIGNILNFWLMRGVDGFRMDAVNHLVVDGKLQDDSDFNLQKYSKNQHDRFEILKFFCKIIGKYKDRCMVTEHYTDIYGMKEYYALYNNFLCMPLNLSIFNISWNAEIIKNFIEDYEKILQKKDVPNYILGNHDRPRLASRIGSEQIRLAAMLLLTLNGVPFIYYGDEIGMTNGIIPENKTHDFNNEKMEGFPYGRDPVRTPMQWDRTEYSGFSNTEPWLPVTDNYKDLNVGKEEKDPLSLLSLYKHLIKLRKKYKSLLNGEYKPLPQPKKDVLAFIREEKDEKILILLNFGNSNESISLPYSSAKIIANTSMCKEGVETSLENFSLEANEGYILLI